MKVNLYYLPIFGLLAGFFLIFFGPSPISAQSLPLVCQGPTTAEVGQHVAFRASGGTPPYGWVARGSNNCGTFCGPQEFGFNPLVTSFDRPGTYTATTTDSSGGGTGVGFQTANCSIEVTSGSGVSPNSSSQAALSERETFLNTTQSYINSLLGLFGRRTLPQSTPPSPPNPNPDPSPDPSPSPNPNPNPDPNTDPGDISSMRVVSDLFALNMSPSIARALDQNGSGKDKCQQTFGGNVREAGYDGGERVLWCIRYANVSYEQGNQEAAVLSDIQLLYPARSCSSLGSGWEEIPGNEGKVITYCQRLQEVSFASIENRNTRAVGYVFAVPLEKSDNPLKRIRDRVRGFLRDLLDIHDAFEDIVPEHSLLNRHLDIISFMIKPIDHLVGDGNEIDESALEETYHHGKADKLFLELKPLYPFNVPGSGSSGGSGSGNGGGDIPDRPGPGPIVRGSSIDLGNSSSILEILESTLDLTASILSAWR